MSETPLFDAGYYLAQNPDIAQAGIDPILHYIRFGVQEGRNPHPLFDTSFYLEQNPDVAQAGLNPLVHYLGWGTHEGRDPHPLFDTSFYLEQNPDVAQAGLNPLVHYLGWGTHEGRDPHPLFDTSFYLEQNPDVAQAGLNPLEHFLMVGAHEERDPHPLFDTSFYLEQRPEVAAVGMNPLAHFLKEGPNEKFDPFSAAVHLPNTGVCIVTPDVSSSAMNGSIGTACDHFARTLAEAVYPVAILFTGELTACQKAHWRNVHAKMGINFIALSDAPLEKRDAWGSSWFLEQSWRIFACLRDARFSVVHFQDWQSNGFWSIKAKQVGLAFDQTILTVMTHSSTKWINQRLQQFSADPFETAKLVWAETYAIEHCDVLLSPSQYMLKWLAENQIHGPGRMVQTPYTCFNRESPAAGVQGQVDNDHLIYLDRFETGNGLHVFGEALRQLRQNGGALPKRLSFLVSDALTVGSPGTGYIEELRQEFDTIAFSVISGLNDTETLSYIRENRGLVVILSILDSYPLTVIECIQGRVPFLAAATGGIPEMIDERVSFEPTPSSLSGLLNTRHTIDHDRLDHKYSSTLARTIWRDLHAELFAMQQTLRGSGERDWLPLGGRKVSVCIPFFNHHRYLARLVAAFSNQRYQDLEIILVNDGSSAEASHEFDRIAAETRDTRFRFLTTENRGPGSARNFAAEQASGELLVFFDADNLPKSNDFIRTLVHALQKSGADCVTCAYDVVAEERDVPGEGDIISTYRPIGPCLETGFLQNNLGDTTMIIDRTVVRKAGGWSNDRAFTWEDHAFLLNLCFRGFKLETVPDPLFYYRKGGRNQTRGNLYLNYETLFRQLQNGPAADLARIIATVAGPTLLQGNSELTTRIVEH